MQLARSILVLGSLLAVGVVVAAATYSSEIEYRLLGLSLGLIVLVNAVAIYIAIMALVEFVRVIIDIESNTRLSAEHLQHFRNSPAG